MHLLAAWNRAAHCRSRAGRSTTVLLQAKIQILHLLTRTSMRTPSFSCFASNSAGKNLAMTSMFVCACRFSFSAVKDPPPANAMHDQLHSRFHDLDKPQLMTYSVRTLQMRGNCGRIAFTGTEIQNRSS